MEGELGERTGTEEVRVWDEGGVPSWFLLFVMLATLRRYN